MKAVILAAGYATRLYPFTKNFPKPLLKVNRKPIIEHILAKLSGISGLSEIFVVSNEKFYGNFQDWKSSYPSRIPVTVINDGSRSPEDRLGAIGDMELAFRRAGAGEDIMVLGGDNFFNDPLAPFAEYAAGKAPSVSVGVYDIKNRNEAVHYGVAMLDRENRVLAFEEKPAHPASTMIAMCLYYFPRESLHLLGQYVQDSGNSKDTAGSYINWLTTHMPVFAYIFRNYWFDIGSLSSYRKAMQAAKGEKDI